MGWYSTYGTGATLHGFERLADGRVRFTSWLSVFFIPILPIRTWSAVFVGADNTASGLPGESLQFADRRRERHDWSRNLKTFLKGLAGVVVAVAPSAFMIAWTTGRGATSLEMAFVFASAVWAVAVVLWVQSQRKKFLAGK